MQIMQFETTTVWYVRTLDAPVRKVTYRGTVVSNHYGPTYKVVRWITSAGTERWTVFASQGMHEFSKWCDPDKPTFKRVVAEVKRLLNGGDRCAS